VHSSWNPEVDFVLRFVELKDMAMKKPASRAAFMAALVGLVISGATSAVGGAQRDPPPPQVAPALKPVGACIVWPPSNTRGITNDRFVPFGPYAGAAPITVTMIDGAGKGTTVTAVQIDGLWYAEFSMLPHGTYTLAVYQAGAVGGKVTGVQLVAARRE
jgi:hypothetical protein